MGVTNFNDIATDDGVWKAGTYTMVAGDDTAGTTSIDTGLSAITMFIVQIYRSDVGVFSDQDVSASSGNLVIADGGATYALTAGDVVNWIAVGTE